MKKRLWKLTDGANDRFYLMNSAATIKDGLAEQIEYFVIAHPDLKLVFVDTFQKVRSPTGDSIYAADYSGFSALKTVADKRGLAMMVVHHTREMADEDIMNTVSGSSGITGSADSIWGSEASVAWRWGRDAHGHWSRCGVPRAEAGAQGLPMEPHREHKRERA